MKTRFRFEKLEVWQVARKLNQQVYQLARRLPKDELFVMNSQMRRASVSVSSNIAEGAGRNSDKDFAHFLEQSYGSIMELASLVYLAFDEHYFTEPEADVVLDKLEVLAKRTVALNHSLSVDKSKTPFPRKPNNT